MKKIVLVAILICSIVTANAALVDMRKAGADASGKKLNTTLINKTIAKLHVNGGGTLFFPSGNTLPELLS